MPDDTHDAGPAQDRGLAERFLRQIVGSVVSPVVDNVDVDEVVERIDVNHVIERLDVDGLIDRVDIERLVERIDVDAVLARVDANRLLDHVEPNRLLDRVDANALLDRVDPDRLLDRVDANALLDRVDPDRLLDRVDPDRLLDRVDINALLDRVDMNALLDRVDIDALVDRTELDAIIARSTTGVFTRLLDVARTQVIAVDQAVQGVPARLLRGERREVPPIPGADADAVDLRAMSFSQRAVALQRHAAGSVSRFLAFLADQFVIGVLFAVGMALLSGATQVVLGTEINLDRNRFWVAATYAIWMFVYTAASLAATGQTIGKGVLGLLVIGADGGRLGGRKAALRTLVFPISFLGFGIGCLLGLFRRDRRELHDLLASTAVIYAWDAETASLRNGAIGDE